MSVPTLHRPRDTYYTLFFLSYIPTIVRAAPSTPPQKKKKNPVLTNPCVVFDSLPLYPPSLVPASLATTHAWYLTTFGDPLIRHQPPWFRFFSLAELFYQLPMAVYLSCGLYSRSPKAPVHMLVWAMLAAFTTATCCWEFAFSEEMTQWQKGMLGGVYGSYGVICEFSWSGRGWAGEGLMGKQLRLWRGICIVASRRPSLRRRR